MSTFPTKRISERAGGWMSQARRVTHCGALRPRHEQQTKRRPHDELCANRGQLWNFHRTTPNPRRGSRCYEKSPCLPVQQTDCFSRGGIHYRSLAGRGPPKNRGGAFRFWCVHAAPPSATIRHLHDQRVRRQGDTPPPRESQLVDELFNRSVQLAAERDRRRAPDRRRSAARSACRLRSGADGAAARPRRSSAPMHVSRNCRCQQAPRGSRTAAGKFPRQHA